MKASDLPKDKNTSVRINQGLLEKLKEDGKTLQQFLDESLDKYIILEALASYPNEEA